MAGHHKEQEREKEKVQEKEQGRSINGPEVQHCRGIVREGGGHLIRRSNNIKQYTVSKAVATLAKKKPKVPFML